MINEFFLKNIFDKPAYYVHQQDAYASEKNDVGTFTQIGYDSPASTVFTYNGDTKGQFKATTKAPLDGISGDWKVVSSISSSTGKTTHSATMPTNADKLTPNFTNIGAGSL